MANAVMNALDALQGSMAECFLTTEDGRRYNFMQIYKMEVKMDIPCQNYRSAVSGAGNYGCAEHPKRPRHELRTEWQH